MIPTLIQRRGAQHLAEEEAAQVLSSRELSSADEGPVPSPPPGILELLPESVARENNVIPLWLEGRTLHVAAADPSNIMLRDKLSFILNKDIRLVEYSRAAILRAIRQSYAQTRTESVDSMLVEFTDTAIESTQTGGIDLDGAPQSQAYIAKARGGSSSRSLGQAAAESRKGMKGVADEPRQRRLSRPRPPGIPTFDDDPGTGEDTTPDYGTQSMWHYTVEEGQRALMIRRDGRMEVIVGPKRVWIGSSRFEKMRHFVAPPATSSWSASATAARTTSPAPPTSGSTRR